MRCSVLLLAAALPVVGCVRSSGSAPAPDASATPATPAATPTPTLMPAQWIAGFPGWLGFGVAESGSDMDTPEYAPAHVAIPDLSQDWSALGKNTLRALAPGYAEDVAFIGKKEIRFGCEENRATFSFFRGEHRPKSGPVWLVPAGTPASVVEPVEIPGASVSVAIRDAGPKKLRAWRAGDVVFVSRRTDRSLIAEIWEGETRLWRHEDAWKPMQGGDDVPPDLDGGPGVPIPRLLLVSGAASVLVVQRDGFEGTGFRGYRIEERGGADRRGGSPPGGRRADQGRIEKSAVSAADDGIYLYWCAF